MSNFTPWVPSILAGSKFCECAQWLDVATSDQYSLQTSREQKEQTRPCAQSLILALILATTVDKFQRLQEMGIQILMNVLLFICFVRQATSVETSCKDPTYYDKDLIEQFPTFNCYDASPWLKEDQSKCKPGCIRSRGQYFWQLEYLCCTFVCLACDSSVFLGYKTRRSTHFNFSIYYAKRILS